MPHPDHVVPVEEVGAKGRETSETAKLLPVLEPIYPLTAGLTNTSLRKAIAQSLARLPVLPEWIGPSWRERNAWPSFADALRRMHVPETEADLGTAAPPRLRLAYDELFANQLALAIIRQRLRRSAGRRLAAPGKLRQAILATLPFKLTGAQRRALAEIDADLASPHRMLRLLHGDVLVPARPSSPSRHDDGRGSGSTGGADGADRDVGRAAPQDHRRLRCSPWTADRAADRPRGRGRGARRPLTARKGRADILIGTHALL